MCVDATYIPSSSQMVQKIINKFLTDRKYEISSESGQSITMVTPRQESHTSCSPPLIFFTNIYIYIYQFNDSLFSFGIVFNYKVMQYQKNIFDFFVVVVVTIQSLCISNLLLLVITFTKNIISVIYYQFFFLTNNNKNTPFFKSIYTINFSSIKGTIICN